METKQRIISILSEIKRPGMDQIIENIKDSSYFSVGCYKHHTYEGGMADHALEVMDYMLSHNIFNLSEESIKIVGLFHDLGKIHECRHIHRKGHDIRSLICLQNWGLELTEDEKMALTNHHFTPEKIFCPLYSLTVKADCNSTGKWKNEHHIR